MAISPVLSCLTEIATRARLGDMTNPRQRRVGKGAAVAVFRKQTAAILAQEQPTPRGEPHRIVEPMSEQLRGAVIERQECPEHGTDTGMVRTGRGGERCGHSIKTYRTCDRELVTVRYVPEVQLTEAVETLRKIAAGPDGAPYSELWSKAEAQAALHRIERS